MADEVQAQRDYYARTAQHYDAMHVQSRDEHGVALSAFAGLVSELGAVSILDVGAGTGRALDRLAALLPQASLLGVEPVRELREVGHARGIAPDRLIEGDALNLPFADGSFDFVIETGALHHIPTPARAVAEMARVARRGVMISDSNKFGQGSAITRFAKAVIGRLGLWNAMIWLTTRGKMAKWSEGDGVYYSYSAFDDFDVLRAKFPRVYMMNTVPAHGFDLRRGSSHVCLIAMTD